MLGLVAIIVGIGAIAPSVFAGGYAPKIYRVKLIQEQVDTARIHPGQKNVFIGQFTLKAYLPTRLTALNYHCTGDVFSAMRLVPLQGAQAEDVELSPTLDGKQSGYFYGLKYKIKKDQSQIFRVYADVKANPTSTETRCGVVAPSDLNVYVTKNGESIYSGTLGNFGVAFGSSSIVVQKKTETPKAVPQTVPDITVLQGSAGGKIAMAGDTDVALGMFVVETSAPIELSALTYTCTVPAKSLGNMKLMFDGKVGTTVSTIDVNGNATATFVPHISVSDKEPLLVTIVGDLTDAFVDQVNVYCGVRSATMIDFTDLATGVIIRAQALEGDFGLQTDDAPIYMIPKVI